MMFKWGSQIDPTSIASVLGEKYARFASPVASALGMFLDNLPEHRQAEILATQAALPESASIERRLAVLAQSCPVLHKLGQVLARDRHLSAELREELQQLESLPPTLELPVIEQELAKEFGPLEQRGVELLPPAIAEASVAVVIGYQQQTAAGVKQGVFKLLKPDIEHRLQEELETMSLVGEHLDQQCQHFGIPAINYQESFEQVREKLTCEVNLQQEQRHLQLAAEFYRHVPSVHVPELYEHCTKRVTAMERLTGSKITDVVQDDLRARRALAYLTVEALIARPIFSTDSQMVFHCDPHAGNLLLTEEGRLGILDWSLVGKLNEHQRVALVQVMLAASTLSSSGVARALIDLADEVADPQALAVVAREWIKKVRCGELPGLRWLVAMMDEAHQSAGLRLSADLLLFRKTLHTFDGVLDDLSADDDRMDEVLFGQFVQQFISEWPRRFAAMPHSREFATRLSNFDLTRSLMEIPNTATRYWLGRIRDLISAIRHQRYPSNHA